MFKKLACLGLFILCFTSSGIKLDAFQDFRHVAKKAIPAVVALEIRKHQPGNKSAYLLNPGQRFEEGADSNHYKNPSWEQFHGFTPRAPNSPPPIKAGFGSGFLINSDGYIVTNYHVIRDSAEVLITLSDGRQLEAAFVGADVNTDIAVVKIQGEDLPYLKFANSDQLEIGEWVVAIGSPLGLRQSLTVGVVSGKGRNHLELADYEDFIQTDAAINQGNSGGPLLNLDGDVIGINTAIATAGGSRSGHIGIGFAIPSNMARLVTEQLISTGSVQRGYLGLALQALDRELAHAFGLSTSEGALVVQVAESSPAANAGIRQGDIILELNGNSIENNASFAASIALLKPHTPISVTILRDNKEQVLDLVLGTVPELSKSSSSKNTEIGIIVQQLTPELASELSYDGERGVVIQKIQPGSPGEAAKLRRGILILDVNHQIVEDTEEFNRLIHNAVISNKPIVLRVKQGNLTRYVYVKVR